MAVRKPPFYISTLAPRLLRTFSQLNVKIYQATNGRLLGGSAKRPLCLLTTKGRKSGQDRTTPLLFVEDGENVLLVAAQGGLPANPGWYWNLTDDPHCTIQIGAQRREMIATFADPDERAEWWPKLTAHYSGWASYQSWTDREIPVVICIPFDG